jgi:hypothetical protein
MGKVVAIQRDAAGVTGVGLEDAAIDVSEAQRIFPDLIAIATKRDDLAETYRAAVDAAAHRTGASKKSINACVKAMVQDKTRDMFAEAAEFCDLLEALVPGVAEQD